jgi:hypothetical protein
MILNKNSCSWQFVLLDVYRLAVSPITDVCRGSDVRRMSVGLAFLPSDLIFPIPCSNGTYTVCHPLLAYIAYILLQNIRMFCNRIKC